ncbi:triphosphoribosyl-dephospho-CoA synthase [Roseimaritima sediminicola]|uniref:triphosphoribosyl-dephospho-CoA synthase n=1 Tax=Roseimaritima sediminicola TaxID=2662066 RepID=UPI0013876826|nr:triphosphoribosyl-dephospho-CoA synthase [Roseimaritima sediminicola]
MIEPIGTIARSITSPADRIRWACVLEATAPKAGNVFPGAAFSDLRYADFVLAADAIAEPLAGDQTAGCGGRILDAVRRTRQVCHSNVNLGMVLLLGPLVEAERVRQVKQVTLQQAVRLVLAGLTADDSRDVYRAIRIAGAGGLDGPQGRDRPQQMDVHQPAPHSLIAAMRSAAHRDDIARQYATDFEDLLGPRVLGKVRAAISDSGDVLAGIQRAQIELLADRVDTLIVRKVGMDVARQVQQHAASVRAAADFASAWQAFDSSLRADGHRRNPGTTADLIAAALWCLLGEAEGSAIG